MSERELTMVNPTWDEVVAKDPLIAFSFYLSGRKNGVLELGQEVNADLDAAFAESIVDSGLFMRAEMRMWFWTLGAYEVVRTMCQASNCFSARFLTQLNALKKELAQARMPAAKMEEPGKKVAVTSNRSPAGLDISNRDLLIGSPSGPGISARQLLARFRDVVSSITPADVLASHENSYNGKA